MSNENSPRVGLLEQLKAAISLEQVKTLSAEFSTFTYASEKTCRRVARVVAAKNKELS